MVITFSHLGLLHLPQIISCYIQLPSACVFFRNQTGIKHWKIDFRDGLYFLGASIPYTCLSDLVEVCFCLNH